MGNLFEKLVLKTARILRGKRIALKGMLLNKLQIHFSEVINLGKMVFVHSFHSVNFGVGMSTFYHHLPRSENYKENPRNSTSTLWKSREEVLKEVEKFNGRIPPEIKIISSDTEGPTRQRVNSVLTEEEESAMRDH